MVLTPLSWIQPLGNLKDWLTPQSKYNKKYSKILNKIRGQYTHYGKNIDLYNSNIKKYQKAISQGKENEAQPLYQLAQNIANQQDNNLLKDANMQQVDKNKILSLFLSDKIEKQGLKNAGVIKTVFKQYRDLQNQIAEGNPPNMADDVLKDTLGWYENVLDGYKKGLKDKAKDTKSATKAVLELEAAERKAIATEKLRKVGGMIANAVAMTAITTAISIGIQVISKAIDKLILTQQEAAENIEQMHSKFTELNNGLQQNQKVLKDTAKRYEYLSKGVDAFGKNMSLSIDEFAEYESLSNQIADQFPALITGYTDTGTAVLACRDNVALLNDEYERQNGLLQAQIVANSNGAYKDYNTLYNKETVDTKGIISGILQQDVTAIIFPVAGIVPIINQITNGTKSGSLFNKSSYTSSKSTVEEYKDLKTIFEDTNLSYEERQSQIKNVLGEYKNLANGTLKLKSLLNDAGIETTDFNTFNQALELATNNVDSLLAHYETMTNDIKTANQQLATEVILPRLQYGTGYQRYQQASQESQEAINGIIQRLDVSQLDDIDVKDSEALTNWVNDNIVTPILNSGSEVQDAYQKLLKLDVNKLSYNDYMNQLNTLLLTISEGVGGDAGKQIADNILEGMKLDEEGVADALDNIAKPKVSNPSQYKINEFSPYDLDTAIGFAQNRLDAAKAGNTKIATAKDLQASDIRLAQGKYATEQYQQAMPKAEAAAEFVKNTLQDKFTSGQIFKLDMAMSLNPEFEWGKTEDEIIAQANELLEELQVKIANEQGFNFNDYAADYETTKESLNKIKDAYDKLTDGTLTDDEKLDIVTAFPKLQPYLDNVDKLKEKLQALSFVTMNSLVEDLTKLKAQITNPQTQNEIQAYIDMLQGSAYAVTNPLKSFSDALNDIKSVYDVIDTMETQMKDYGRISGDTLTQIAGLSDKLSGSVAKYIEGDIGVSQLLEDVKTYYNTVKSENADYLITVNQNMIDAALEAYNVDISNCQNYAEAKQKILASITGSTVVGTTADGTDLKLGDFYDIATGQYTDLYVSYAKAGGEFSNSIIAAVATYVDLINNGIDLALEGIDDDKIKKLLEKIDDSNKDLQALQKKIEKLNHQKAMGLLSQEQFDAQYSVYAQEAVNIRENNNLNESDLSTVNSIEEQNYSQGQSAYERKYTEALKNISNAYDDATQSVIDFNKNVAKQNSPLFAGRDAFEQERKLLEQYYGENGLINDIDGTTYEDTLRELSQKRVTYYEQEIERIQNALTEGNISIPKAQELLANSYSYWLDGIPQLASTAATKMKEAVTMLYDAENSEIDKQQARGKLNDTDYAREKLRIWKQYYKDKENLRNEDYQAEQDAISAARDATQSQIDAVQSLIDKNSDDAETQTSIIEEQQQQTEDYYDALIKQIQDQVDAIEEKADEEDRYLKILEAEDALERARRQHTIARVQANGTIRYAADEEAIKQAEKDLKEAKEEDEKSKLEKQIKALEDEKEAKVNDYEKQKEAISEALKTVNAPLEDIVTLLSEYLADTYNVDVDFIKTLLGNDVVAKEFAKINEQRRAKGEKELTGEELSNIISQVATNINSEPTQEQLNNAMTTALETTGYTDETIDDTLIPLQPTTIDTAALMTMYDKLFDTPIPVTFSDAMVESLSTKNNTQQTINNQNCNNNVTVTFNGGITVTRPVGDVSDLAKDIEQNFANVVTMQIRRKNFG